MFEVKKKKNTESKNPKVVKTKNGRIMLSSKWTQYESKKARLVKEQETNGLSSSLRAKKPL